MLDNKNLIYNSIFDPSLGGWTGIMTDAANCESTRCIELPGGENVSGKSAYLALNDNYDIPYVYGNTYRLSFLTRKLTTGTYLLLAYGYYWYDNNNIGFWNTLQGATGTIDEETLALFNENKINVKISDTGAAWKAAIKAEISNYYIGLFISPAWGTYLPIFTYKIEAISITGYTQGCHALLTISSSTTLPAELVSYGQDIYVGLVTKGGLHFLSMVVPTTVWTYHSDNIKDIPPIVSRLCLVVKNVNTTNASIQVSAPCLKNLSQELYFDYPTKTKFLILEDKKGILTYDNNIGKKIMYIKYIRSYAKKWIEILAFDKLGRNVLFGLNKANIFKRQGIYCSKIKYNCNNVGIGILAQNASNYLTHIITNNDFISEENYMYTDDMQLMTITLPYAQRIEKIIIKNYGTGKNVSNGKLEVSSDGTSWYTLYDSSIHGSYVEELNGKTFYLDTINGENQLAVDSYNANYTDIDTI